MAPRFEDELAADLAAAVAKHADFKPGWEPFPEEVEEGLYKLLYGDGADGVIELTIAERTPTSVTILGLVIWLGRVETAGPLEAAFELDEASGSVTAMTVRAGDQRVERREAPPPKSASARAVQRLIAARPTADEDWTRVIRYELG